MAINEAPWLTTRLVVGLMAIVLLLCIAADQLQCSKRGWTYSCTGPPPYRCNQYDLDCAELTHMSTYTVYGESCLNRGAAEVVFAVVEVGPTIVSPQDKPISSYMAEEIQARVQKKLFLAKGNPGYSRCSEPFSILNQFGCISDDLGRLAEYPRNTTQFSVSNDVVTLPAYRLGTGFKYVSWEDALKEALPTSTVDDPTQLARYFPNMHRMLEAAVRRRKRRGAADARCDAIELVVYVVMTPLTAVRGVWASGETGREQMNLGRILVMGAVSRYMATQRRILKYLDGVRYVHLYVPPPSRSFTYALVKEPWNPYVRGWPRTTTTQEPNPEITGEKAYAAEVTNGAATLDFCRLANTSAQVTQCTQHCEDYDEFSVRASALDGSYAKLLHAVYGVARVNWGVACRYYNCYFDILNVDKQPRSNGTFNTTVQAEMFDDCYHLSPTGAKAFATCLLSLNGYPFRRNRYSHEGYSW